jgi:hypothetical protein
MDASPVPLRLTRTVLATAAVSTAALGISQILPSFTAPQVVPWRQPTGWFMLFGGLVLAASAWRCVRPFACRWAFWRWLLSGMVIVYAATVLTVGGAAWARYVFRALAVGWVVMLTILSQARPLGDRAWVMRRCLKVVDVVAANVALFLVLGELSLRAYAAWSGHSLLISSGMEAFRLAPNRNYGDLLSTNRHGYPSREFEPAKRPGVFRIAALGDSFAVGVVRQDYNYLTLLETLRPNTEVYNFGVAGIGPQEYYEILQAEIWPYTPDLVLVSFFVGNDVRESMQLNVKLLGAKRRRMHPEGFGLYVFAQRAWRLTAEWFSHRESPPTGDRVTQPYTLLSMSRATHLQIEARRLDVCRPSRAQSLEKHWGHSLTYLDKIIDACRRRQVPVAVVLIPDEFQVNPVLLEEVLQTSQVPREDVDLDLPQRRLRAFLAEKEVPYLDLKPVFAGVADTYRPRDTHWNERGNRLAAEQIAAWLGSLDGSESLTASFPGRSRH